MNVVVDTNIIFSALLPQSKKIRDILCLEKNLSFYSCNFAMVEVFKNKEKILRYAQVDEEKILRALHKIFKRITFFREELISSDSLKLAYNLCIDVDIKDVYFVALAIELNGALWTGDTKLKEGLRKRGFDRFL